MLKFNEPMSKHCSLRSGGATSEFFQPTNIDELSEFLKNNKKPVLLVGLGSNLLVRDSGFKGVTIHTKNLKELSISKNLIESVQAPPWLNFLDLLSRNLNMELNF